MIWQLLFVSIGGACGASLRFLISQGIYRRWPTEFPVGTLTVNIAGCLMIGVLMRASEADVISAPARLLLITGLLGALTTFSTFGIDTIRLLQQSEWLLAVVNVAANVVLSLIAVSAGLWMGRFVVGT